MFADDFWTPAPVLSFPPILIGEWLPIVASGMWGWNPLKGDGKVVSPEQGMLRFDGDTCLQYRVYATDIYIRGGSGKVMAYTQI